MNKIMDMLLAAISAFVAAVIVYMTYISPPGWLETHKDTLTAVFWWAIGIVTFVVAIKRARELDKFRRRHHHYEHGVGECQLRPNPNWVACEDVPLF